VLQKPALALDASPISGERSIRPNHAMAGHDNGHGVAAVREPNGANSRWTPDPARELPYDRVWPHGISRRARHTLV